MQSMDRPIQTSLLLGSYGDILSQGHYHYHNHHHQEALYPPPSASVSCLYKARTQDGSHSALDSAVLTHAHTHTRAGNSLLYPGSCPPLASLGATSGSGALAEINAPSLQSVSISRPYTDVKNGDVRTQGRNTHDRPGLSREEAQQREDPDRKAHKRRHSRPTFTGYQIYVLEKTFEQNRYLSSKEKQRLAVSLGMTDSQVKVWFQNRRTKWRKTVGSEPEKTRVKPSHGKSQLEGDFDKPLDPNNEDDRVQSFLQRHESTNRGPSRLLALQMASADQTMHTHVS